MSTPIQLSPELVARLRQLNVVKQQAAQRFNDAADGALLALGLDPTLNHALNLDTGVLTPAQPEQSGK